MNLLSPKIYRVLSHRRLLAASFVAGLTFILTLSLHAQQPQLTLADLLIGLRSKKVSLADRNSILTEAVRQRGITFASSPEIDKELVATGASKELLNAIVEKSPVKVSVPVPSPTPLATPIPTPTPPDFSFYQRRADANLDKGEYTLALADYDKVVELKADDAVAFLNRGRTQYNLKAFDKAGADYNKAIELDPKDSRAFYNRGVLLEKLGQPEKALVDYKKATELDPANESAKTGLDKLQNEQLAKAAKVEPQPPIAKPVAEVVKPPERINLGNLNAANATRMVTPLYSAMAQKIKMEGKVTVDLEIDEEGNVTSAKAVSGPQLLRKDAEDAARKSKFKPATFESQPIKSIGSITYNFSLTSAN